MGGPGCSRRHRCCGADPATSPSGCSPRYSCCGAPVTGREGREGREGCTKVCRKCGELWGLPAGECYVREHNLVDLQEQEQEQEEEEKEEKEVEEIKEKDNLLSFVKPVKENTFKTKKKIVEMLERYPPVITYHMF